MCKKKKKLRYYNCIPGHRIHVLLGPPLGPQILSHYYSRIIEKVFELKIADNILWVKIWNFPNFETNGFKTEAEPHRGNT